MLENFAEMAVILETENPIMHITDKKAMTENEVMSLKEKCIAKTFDIACDLPVKDR